jgi:hypothetical protein
MDRIITSLSASDLLLIEKPGYTSTISASDINYVSTYFPKLYTLIGSNGLNVNIVNGANLEVKGIRTLNNKTATLSGNYNTFTVKAGLVVSAYNTVSSELTSVSASIDTALSAFSASVTQIFYDYGYVEPSKYIHQGPPTSNGATEIIITGSKTVPEGLTIGAQDITLAVLYNGFINTAYTVNNTTFPFVYIKDFDYNISNPGNGLPDDAGNNYVNAAPRIVAFNAIIANWPTDGVKLLWKVLKYY